MILGVRCTVVRDTVSENGKPIERTFDWYAQDKKGNVWYMGELSLESSHGRFVKASDSWESERRAPSPESSCPPTHGEATRTGRSTTHPVERWTRRTHSVVAGA